MALAGGPAPTSTPAPRWGPRKAAGNQGRLPGDPRRPLPAPPRDRPGPPTQGPRRPRGAARRRPLARPRPAERPPLRPAAPPTVQIGRRGAPLAPSSQRGPRPVGPPLPPRAASLAEPVRTRSRGRTHSPDFSLPSLPEGPPPPLPPRQAGAGQRCSCPPGRARPPPPARWGR